MPIMEYVYLAPSFLKRGIAKNALSAIVCIAIAVTAGAATQEPWLLWLNVLLIILLRSVAWLEGFVEGHTNPTEYSFTTHSRSVLY